MTLHPGLSRPCVALFLALLLSACGDDSQQLRSQLADVRAESDSLQAANQVLETRLAAARIAARTAGTRLANQNQQLQRAAQHTGALSRSETALRLSLQRSRATIARLQGELTGATRALKAEGARNADLARRLGATKGWLGQRTAHGQSQDVALKDLEDKLAQSTREQTTLRTRADGLHQDLQKSIATALRLEATNKSLSASARMLRKSLTTAQDSLETQTTESAKVRSQLNLQLSDAEQQAAQLRGSNEQLKVRVQALRDELSAVNERTDGFRRAKEYLAQKMEMVSAESATIGKRVASLRDERNEAAQLLVAQREELSTALAASEKAHEVAGARVNGLEAEVNRLDAALKSESQRAADAAASAEAARKARDYLEGKLAGIQEELNGVRDRSRSRIARLEQALHLSVEEARLLATRMQTAETTGTEAQARQAELEQEVTKLESTLTKAKQIPERLNARIEELERLLARARGVSDDLKVRSAELQEVVAAQERDNDSLAQRHEQAVAKQSELMRSAEALEERLTEARGITEGLNTRITELETTIGSLEDNNTALAAKLESASREQAACAAARKGDEAAIRDLKWGNDTLIGQIESLESRIKELEASSGNCELRRTAL